MAKGSRGSKGGKGKSGPEGLQAAVPSVSTATPRVELREQRLVELGAKPLVVNKAELPVVSRKRLRCPHPPCRGLRFRQISTNIQDFENDGRRIRYKCQTCHGVFLVDET